MQPEITELSTSDMAIWPGNIFSPPDLLSEDLGAMMQMERHSAWPEAARCPSVGPAVVHVGIGGLQLSSCMYYLVDLKESSSANFCSTLSEPLPPNRDRVSSREQSNTAGVDVDCRCGFPEVLRVRGASHGEGHPIARDEYSTVLYCHENGIRGDLDNSDHLICLAPDTCPDASTTADNRFSHGP